MLVILLAGGLFVLPATPRSQQVSIYEKHWRGSYSNTFAIKDRMRWTLRIQEKKVLQRTYRLFLFGGLKNGGGSPTTFAKDIFLLHTIFVNIFLQKK